MHTHDLSNWQHDHHYLSGAERDAERRTRLVVFLTLATMFGELVVGWLSGSMALLADGWHMGSHAGALGLSVFAYAYARRHLGDERFTFGTGKVLALAGYSNALILAAGAAWMLAASAHRLFNPVEIHYQEAIAVAWIGLAVNLVSAWLLRDGHHDHHHGHHHGNDHGAHDHDHADHEHHDAHHHHGGHAHADHNLRAAYLHVLADSLTSVFAIVALAFGMWFGWNFLDPVMGLAGGVLVGGWAWGLAVQSGRTLLDAETFDRLKRRVRERIEADADNQVADLHVWRLGPAGMGCIVSLVTHEPRPAAHYHALLDDIEDIAHLTIEVNHCQSEACRRGIA